MQTEVAPKNRPPGQAHARLNNLCARATAPLLSDWVITCSIPHTPASAKDSMFKTFANKPAPPSGLISAFTIAGEQARRQKAKSALRPALWSRAAPARCMKHRAFYRKRGVGTTWMGGSTWRAAHQKPDATHPAPAAQEKNSSSVAHDECTAECGKAFLLKGQSLKMFDPGPTLNNNDNDWLYSGNGFTAYLAGGKPASRRPDTRLTMTSRTVVFACS